MRVDGLSRPWVLIALIALLAILAGSQIESPDQEEALRQIHPMGVMGTESTIAAIFVPESDPNPLVAAERELRRLEALFSGWIDASEVSTLNRSPEGMGISVSEEVFEVVSTAYELHGATQGAFDVTSGPLIERWRRAGQEGVLPTAEELREARLASGWSDFEIEPAQALEVRKSRASARLDLDGLAKGHAIDLALEALLAAGARGGLVEVGGDLRVGGEGAEGDSWRIGLRSPYEDRAWGTLLLRDSAICTSGPYHRSVEIDGRRFSHVVDPRSLQPAQATVSTTVVGPDTLRADAWATALSVLGVEGLALLPRDLHGLVVTGEASRPQAVATPGFLDLLEDKEFEVEIFDFREGIGEIAEE